MNIKSDSKPPILTLTDNAVKRVSDIIKGSNEPAIGIRISVKTQGCNGMKYDIQYVQDPIALDEVIELENGHKVFIDPMAVMFIIGSEMDWEESEM